MENSEQEKKFSGIQVGALWKTRKSTVLRGALGKNVNLIAIKNPFKKKGENQPDWLLHVMPFEKFEANDEGENQ